MMKETKNNDNNTRYNIKRLVNICELFAAGSLVGIVVYLRQINSFIRDLAESREVVSHGYSTLFGYSVTTISGKSFHCFDWGAVCLFLLIFALILIEVGISTEKKTELNSSRDDNT